MCVYKLRIYVFYFCFIIIVFWNLILYLALYRKINSKWIKDLNVKVKTKKETRADVINIVDIFRANIIDVATESLTIEITGDEDKIKAFTALMEPFGVKEIVRTGLTALCRGNGDIE